jgi:2,4-dienoyl-CoA reductase-like NADH-dependent reductase (Old Yellow Enzyme family)
VPVLLEGGVRSREQIDRLLGSEASGASERLQTSDDLAPVCDAVGMGRPFYAEPRLPARLLDATNSADGTDDAEITGGEVLCENCNNCTVPQVTGANGVCRTAEILAERGELAREGAYERD